MSGSPTSNSPTIRWFPYSWTRSAVMPNLWDKPCCPGEPLRQTLLDAPPSWIEALAVLVPERFGIELLDTADWDLEPYAHRVWTSAFLKSICVRRPSAVAARCLPWIRRRRQRLKGPSTKAPFPTDASSSCSRMTETGVSDAISARRCRSLRATSPRLCAHIGPQNRSEVARPSIHRFPVMPILCRRVVTTATTCHAPLSECRVVTVSRQPQCSVHPSRAF